MPSPKRYVAFLRAINVGGHTVSMARLRELFGELGFGAVQTFIASGNVVFECRTDEPGGIELRIEKHLFGALGFEAAAFVRSDAEVAAIAAYRPSSQDKLRAAGALNVALLKAPLPSAARKAIMAFRTPVDDFHVKGREAYWLTRGRQNESPFFRTGFERALGVSATVRGMNTIRRLADRLAEKADR